MQRVHATSFASVLGIALLGVAPLSGWLGAAPDEYGALAPYLDGAEPDIYLELFDLPDLERDLRDSGLARLAERCLPLLDLELDVEGLDEAVDRLGFDPRDVLRGELSFEDALARSLYTLATEQLGVERDHALRLVASLGQRFSVALRPESERVAVSWSLRGGGYTELSRFLRQKGAELADRLDGGLVALDPGSAGAGEAWALELEGERVFLALRPDLLALTNDSAWARAVAFGAARGRGTETDLIDARLAALLSGQPVWGWFGARAMGALAGSEGELRAQTILGLDGLESLQLSLGGEGGQFVSRLRVDFDARGPRGLFDLVQPGAVPWSGLDHVTGDTLLVLGLADGPAAVARRAVDLIQSLDGATVELALDSFLTGARDVPVLAELMDSGAGGEAVFFLRSGAAGLPTPYLVLPAEARLLERLAALDPAGEAAVEHRLKLQQLDGRPCWSIGSGMEGLALTHVGDTVIAAQSAFALKDYLRQLDREGERSPVGPLPALRGAIEARSSNTRRLIGFAHVRVEPLAESVWPWLMLGLNASGAEGLEDLPDAFEFAEEIGDTTLLLFEDDTGLELHGRGLFGGLGVLF